MKFSAFAVIIVVLTADHGAEFRHIQKHHLSPEAQLKRLIEEMSSCVDGVVLDTNHLVDRLSFLQMRNPNLHRHFSHGDTEKIKPEDVPGLITDLPVELDPLFPSIEKQIKSLTDNFNRHAQHVALLFHRFYKELIMRVNAMFSAP